MQYLVLGERIQQQFRSCVLCFLLAQLILLPIALAAPFLLSDFQSAFWRHRIIVSYVTDEINTVMQVTMEALERSTDKASLIVFNLGTYGRIGNRRITTIL